MHKYIKFLLIIFVVFLFTKISVAQINGSIEDTISVTALQKFQVPNGKNAILTPVLKTKLEAELLDSNGKVIRHITNTWQSPSPQKMAKEVKSGRGATVQYHVSERIQNTGKYYVRLNISAMDENKKLHVYKPVYLIYVKNPTMTSPITLRKSRNYYYTEKEKFSFMTVEYNDPKLYSYKIEDTGGNILKNGKGGIVTLDDVLNNVQNVGRHLTIVGLYNGKRFKYTVPGDKDIQNSEWTINVLQPTLDEFSDWKKTSSDSSIIYISAFNTHAHRILYSYNARNDQGGYVFVRPEAKNFHLVADPPNIIKNSRAVASGVFLYVTFEFNKDYINSMEKCSSQPITLTIQFTDQFGSLIKKVYKAVILN